MSRIQAGVSEVQWGASEAARMDADDVEGGVHDVRQSHCKNDIVGDEVDERRGRHLVHCRNLKLVPHIHTAQSVSVTKSVQSQLRCGANTKNNLFLKVKGGREKEGPDPTSGIRNVKCEKKEQRSIRVWLGLQSSTQLNFPP